MKFSGKVGNINEQLINFGGDPDHRLDTGIFFPDSTLYWEIGKA